MTKCISGQQVRVYKCISRRWGMCVSMRKNVELLCYVCVYVWEKENVEPMCVCVCVCECMRKENVEIE